MSKSTTAAQNGALDLTEVLRGYEDMWVVLSPDKTQVIASGESFDALSASLSKGVALKVPKFVPFIPANIV